MDETSEHTTGDEMAKLEALIAEQDAEHEAKQAEHDAKIAKITGGRSIAAYVEEMTMSEDTSEAGLDETDDDRLLLLDRIADRMPDLNLDEHEVAWHRLPDGSEALLVDGGGLDGGVGVYFANAGDDVHAIGPIPQIKSIGAIVVKPDGTRVLAQVAPDPLAEQGDDEQGPDS